MADSVLSLLRRARRLDSKAFDAAVRDYLERGVTALTNPRGRGGRKKKIGRANYMMLLAFVRNEPPRSEARLLREWAKRGMPWANAAGVGGKWFSEPTIKSHLRKAKQMYDDDPSFAAEVESTRGLLRMINSR